MQALDFCFKVAVFATLVILTSGLLSGCQLGYLMQAADGQYRLIAKKVSFEKVLDDPQVSEETKRKIRLVQEVKQFSETELNLAHTKNYDSFVQLGDKYVTWAVTASSKDRIEPYLWSFPFVGKVPYKGYFKKQSALDEGEEMKRENYDVLVRGVSAYSTLGWFSDPLLSSMLYDNDADLVDTIIHETTHATIYVKSNADFNERLATFVGKTGTELFYQKKEGEHSPTLAKFFERERDADVFFGFVTEQIKKMEEFYKINAGKPDLIKLRETEFENIKKRFKSECQPRLKSNQYNFFSDIKLNNAVLLNYKIYYHNLGLFKKLYTSVNHNWKQFFEKLKPLKDSKQPEEDLKKILD